MVDIRVHPELIHLKQKLPQSSKCSPSAQMIHGKTISSCVSRHEVNVFKSNVSFGSQEDYPVKVE